jgi:hypothetical protein
MYVNIEQIKILLFSLNIRPKSITFFIFYLNILWENNMAQQHFVILEDIFSTLAYLLGTYK